MRSDSANLPQKRRRGRVGASYQHASSIHRWAARDSSRRCVHASVPLGEFGLHEDCNSERTYYVLDSCLMNGWLAPRPIPASPKLLVAYARLIEAHQRYHPRLYLIPSLPERTRPDWAPLAAAAAAAAAATG